MKMVGKIRAGFFSLCEIENPSDYIGWHQMDHTPEQFRLPSIAFGQRFIATDKCVAASAVRVDPIGQCRHLQNYLVTDPATGFAELVELGAELMEQGRYRRGHGITPHIQIPIHLYRIYAAPQAEISAEAVPFRFNRGIYLIVEDADDSVEVDQWARVQHGNAAAILDVPGVAGMWCYATEGATVDETPFGLPVTRYRLTVIYLDRDPVEVAEALREPLARRWRDAPVTPMLAGPFRSLYSPPKDWIFED
jgi:hypothetical protein